jgi:Ca-activated chloride channel family protein
MTFDDAGVNPWRQTERDALSTFAVDVDTGSYPLVRRYLADDLLPPVAAVRPEEVLNYFGEAYDYAPPLLGTFAVHADGAPSPFDRREHVLRIGIKGREVRDRARKPLALTLVIDVSGSMEEGGRLELVKDGLIHLVEQLAEEDDLAIVAYSTNARVVLERRAMDSREARREAMDAIDSLRPSNSTNAEAGLTLAYDLADEGWRKEAVNKVVLASDGVANVGATGPGTILDRIGDYVRREITLTAIGVGMGNYNDALLEQLADRGDGSYHYIDDYTEMRRVMVDGLVSTLQTIALDAKVQVEFDPENVYAWRLIGYENRHVADRDFTNDRVDAGEIGAGQSVTALYAIELEREPRGTLATVRVRWQDPDGGPVDEIDERVTVGALTDDFEDASAGLRLATAAAGFAELLREGDWARTARFDEVADIAMRVSDERERVRDDEVAELARLAERAGWLRGGVGYGGRIEGGERERRWGGDDRRRDEDERDRDRWRGDGGR